MPGYVAAALQKFQHPPPTKKQDAPLPWNRLIYGAHTQYANPDNDSPLLPPATINQVEQIVGTFLYYGLAVDPTMLVALGDLSSQQVKAAAKIYDKVIWFLNYSATHPEANIRYHSSGMILHVHRDASYLSAPRARIRAGGHYILTDPFNDATTPPKLNVPIHSISKIMDNVMVSAAEAEIGAAYINGWEAIPIRTTLQELNHPQPPTKMQVDNTTAIGFATDTIKQKRTKAINIRFYWICDRCGQGQFKIYFKPGYNNTGDYYTKHHPPTYHRAMRPSFLRTRE